MELSKRAAHLEGSPTLEAANVVRELLARNEDVVRFDVGEPDFETPVSIKEAGIDAIKKGFTHYTSARGIPELRQALVADQKGMGLDVKPSNVAFYPGSKFALFSALSLLIDSGDEVMIQDPVWPTYGAIIEYLGGTPIRAGPWNDIRPSDFPLASFENKTTKRTKAILVNSPCNPTGAIIPMKQLEELLKMCARKKITLLLDRIYSALVYDGSPQKIPSCDIEEGNLVVISGFSKEFAMTGWRLGYTVSSKAFTDVLVDFQDNTTTCASSFVQKAAVVALLGDRSWQKEMNDEYRERRDAMVREIAKIPGWQCATPSGAFYCFPRIHESDSIAFSNSLLTEKRVSSVAGAHFGLEGEAHLRLSYTTPKQRIMEGMKRIRELVSA
ncbi:MAG: aminotransferase class I/II-fold pyridoxal phosphate-dependent enzyme [Nitrososphaerota archaeon]|nr:aminotransferase class I/II-fold pyridoxal phosphate-dependent enzyme [Nitrososphaerota archaeon]